jgi:hypothetical protein
MSMDRSRHDRFSHVAPSAAEVTAAVILVGLFLIMVTPLVVQSVVVWATSGVFAWPDGQLLDAYSGLLRGRFGAGLQPSAAAALPVDPVMWTLTVLGELLVLGFAVVVGLWMRDVAGTGSRHGLATWTQAAEGLGLPRLRNSAAVIRPDLYARYWRRHSVGRD